MVAAACAGFLILFVDRNSHIYSYGLFYNDIFEPLALVAMVTLPALAWALLAPTAQLALRIGLVSLVVVAGWGWWVARASVGASPVDNRALHRAYPLAAGAVVVLALILIYTYRWILGPASPALAPPGRFWRWWAAFRVVAGSVALLADQAFHFIWAEGPRAVAALLAVG